MDASTRSRYDNLASELTTVSTCSALADWQRRVKEEANALRMAIENANAQIEPVLQQKAQLAQSLERARLEFSQRPLLKRLGGDHSAEKDLEAELSDLDQWISTARTEIDQFEKLSSQLVKIIDFVAELGPKTLDDKTHIIKRLQQQKKELKLRRRKVTAKMTAMRREARGASATAGKCGLFGIRGTFGNGKSSDQLAWYDSSLAADQRRGIRAAKEEALRPYELEKADIDQRLLILDKHILFVEQFRS